MKGIWCITSSGSSTWRAIRSTGCEAKRFFWEGLASLRDRHIDKKDVRDPYCSHHQDEVKALAWDSRPSITWSENGAGFNVSRLVSLVWTKDKHGGKSYKWGARVVFSNTSWQTSRGKGKLGYQPCEVLKPLVWGFPWFFPQGKPGQKVGCPLEFPQSLR